MKTTIADPSGSLDPGALPNAWTHGWVSDFAELVKAQLTLLVLVTTAVGFYMGAPPAFAPLALFHAVFGTALAAGGAAALNQWWECRLDALMFRTKSRPIPGGRMSPALALSLGAFLSLAGVTYLAAACNSLSATLAAVTVLLYVFAYTPLKRISTTNTLIGAIPGAIPPLIGWAAVRGELGPGAWSLFIIMFFWQMPLDRAAPRRSYGSVNLENIVYGLGNSSCRPNNVGSVDYLEQQSG